MKLTIVPQPKQMDFYGNMIDVSAFFNHEAQLFLQNRDKRLTYHAKRLCSALIKKENVYHGFHLVFGGGEEQIQKNSFEKCQQYIDAYRLDVNAQGILISAASPQGLFYGIITLERMREQYGCRLPAVSIFDYASVKVRCDYWDLRSIHPPFEKLLANIPVIAGCKLNAIVVEYEDKLKIGEPFCIENQTFSFSPQQFEQMKERCALWFLELIPLQQTFGHLEYVLKDPRFSSLRETPSAVGEMCPCKPQAAEVARALVQNMAKRHPESRYIHIGCDEVWSLGTCKQCAESGKSRVQLFIEFVNQVIEAAAEQGKTPLLWHDMFEHATEEELAQLDRRAVVCIWIYNGNDLVTRVREFAQRLDAAKITYWACPAVRAWDCDDRQNYPVLSERINNIRLWSQAVQELGIQGVINTNWAACFALAKPYGVYETSFYPMYYAAEKCWNPQADDESFIKRFFHDFHGYAAEDDPTFSRGYRNEDYFELCAGLAGKLSKHDDIAQLIRTMRKFELPTMRYFPLTVVLYRQEFFSSSDERGSLENKYLAVKNTLQQVEPEMKRVLAPFLSDYSIQQYMRSRFLVEELLLKQAEGYLSQKE